MLGMAGVAPHRQETLIETTAVEVALELALDIARQGRALCRQLATPELAFLPAGNGNMIASLRDHPESRSGRLRRYSTLKTNGVRLD